MAAPEMKAATFAGFVEATRQTFPHGDFNAVLARLPPATRDIIEKPPSAVSWIPAHAYFDWTTAVVDLLGGGDIKCMRAVARRQLNNDLNGIYKLFVRLSSPDFIISRAASVYGTYWRNHGSIRPHKHQPNSVDVHYEGFPPQTPRVYWELQAGAIAGALDASGCKGVRVDIQRINPDGCSLVAHWT